MRENVGAEQLITFSFFFVSRFASSWARLMYHGILRGLPHAYNIWLHAFYGVLLSPRAIVWPCCACTCTSKARHACWATDF